MTLELMGHCADRYQVSLTAATLKWLSFTEQSAILVTAREGMVLWWRASDSARRLAFANLRSGMELPPQSMAATPTLAISPEDLRSGATAMSREMNAPTLADAGEAERLARAPVRRWPSNTS